jgi:surface protein
VNIRLRNIKKLLSQLPLPFWVSFYIFLLLITLPVLAYIGNFGGAAPGSLTVTIDQKSGTADPNPSYTSVFTVQFSEAIDSATFTSTDITLAGTAPGQQVQSVTEAGSFNQTTYEVRIQATAAGTITPSIAQELITAQNGANGTNQASTSTDNSVTYSGEWLPNEFIIKVKTDMVDTSDPLQFGISGNIPPTTWSGPFNYNVDCNNDGVNEFVNQASDTYCNYDTPGEYTIALTGVYPSMRNAPGSNVRKIIDVAQWGTINWRSLQTMFYGASNMRMSAIDAPRLTSSTDENNGVNVFAFATSFNDDINHWDVSNLVNTDSMFRGATSFNQPLNEWDVGNVSRFASMFQGATSFNRSVDSWDVTSAVFMQAMFRDAISFNQPLNSWDPQNAQWMNSLFRGATSFNQPLNNWNVQNVQDMGLMFRSATAFDQNLSSWNVSSVTSMFSMFDGALAFDQSLGSWDISNVTTLAGMFANGSGLSTSNYDTTLIAWASLPLQSVVAFNAGTSTFCNSEAARQQIIDTYNWTITDAGQECPLPVVATKPATNVSSDSATLNGNTSPLGVTERGFQYGPDINYGQTIVDSSTPTYSFAKNLVENNNASGDIAVDSEDNVYQSNGFSGDTIYKYDNEGNELFTIDGSTTAAGSFSPFGIATDDDDNLYVADTSNLKVLKYDSSGVLQLEFGYDVIGDFYTGGLSSLRDIAIDSAGNIYINDLSRIVKFDSSGNYLSSWGVPGQEETFLNSSYGIVIDDNDDVYFNEGGSTQKIHKTDSNGNLIFSWNLSDSGAPYAITLGYTDLVLDNDNNIFMTGVGGGYRVFQFTTTGTFINEFGPSIPIGPAENGELVIPRGLAVDSYDNIIVGDGGQIPTYNYSIEASLSNLACGTTYHYRAYATNASGTGYGEDQTFTTTECPPVPFIFRVRTDIPAISTETQFRIPANTTDYLYDYNVDCNNDGTFEYTNQTTSVTCSYGVVGEYDIAITGLYPHMYVGGDVIENQKIIDVKQWGTIAWQDMSHMFRDADNLVSFTASDTPDLSSVLSMDSMFRNTDAFNSNIESWDVSNVVDFSGMFSGATSFNQSLNNWNMGSAIYLSLMFSGATAFNQPLNNWDVSNVTYMNSLFQQSAFNQPLSNWSTVSVLEMAGMFFQNTVFNQDISSWNTANVISINQMFSGATAFNQPLNNWDVSSVASMQLAFFGATSFNQPLNNWNITSANSLEGTFALASSFNQNLSSWDTVNVTNMNSTFVAASSFDQSLAAWNVSNVADMTYMFGDGGGQAPGTSGLSTVNYDATLVSWSQQDLEGFVIFDAGTSTYCTAEVQRQSIIDTKFWTINDAGQDCSLTLQGVPGVNYAELTWDESLNPSLDNYFIQYKESSSNTWLNGTQAASDDVDATIWGLEPQTEYDFRLFSRDVNDVVLEVSNPITLTTLAQATYQITNCEEFQAIYIDYQQYTQGNVVLGDMAGRYVVMNDIDCSETQQWEWQLPGPGAGNAKGFMQMGLISVLSGAPFTGIIDGGGHTISNIYQDSNEQSSFGNVGLFASTMMASIRDVRFTNMNIDSETRAPMMSSFILFSVATEIANVYIGGDLQHNLSATTSENTILLPESLDGEIAGNSRAIFHGNLVGLSLGTVITDTTVDFDTQITIEPTDNIIDPASAIVGNVIGIDIASIFRLDPQTEDPFFSNQAWTTYINAGATNVRSLGSIDITNSGRGPEESLTLVGGYEGFVGSRVTKLESSVDINVTNTTTAVVGGIFVSVLGDLFNDPYLPVGDPLPILSNAYYEGEISITNSVSVYSGGIFGVAMGVFKDMYSSGTITVDDVDSGWIGGVGGAFLPNPTLGTGQVIPSSLQNGFSATRLPGTGDFNNTDDQLTRIGGLIGIIGTDSNEEIASVNNLNNYLDVTRTGYSSCVGGIGTEQLIIDAPNTGCNRVNQVNSQPNYFIDNKINPPLNSWDFNSVWRTNYNRFPDFVGSTRPSNPTDPTNPSDPEDPPDDPTNPSGPGGGGTTTTPEPETDSSGNPSFTPDTSEAPLPTNLFIQGATLGPLQRFIQAIPGSVARTIPWTLLLLLIALSLYYLYMAYLEEERRKALRTLIARFKSTQAARASYLDITSHYVNTPLSVMQGTVQVLAGKKAINEELTMAATTQLDKLAKQVQSLLAGAQQTSTSQNAVVTSLERTTITSIIGKPYVWVPLAVSYTLAVLANIIFIQADKYEASTINIAAQIGVAIVGLLAIISSAYYWQRMKQAKRLMSDQIELEKQYAYQQAEFISEAYESLSADLTALNVLGKTIVEQPQGKPFAEALTQLEQTLFKLETVGQLARNIPGQTWQTDVNQAIQAALTEARQAADAKQVSITTQVEPHLIANIGEAGLVHIIRAPLLNAIQFSSPGSQVAFTAVPADHSIVLTTEDHGPGIDQATQDKLFQPFSRSATEQFNYEGMGLDLYLTRVILEQYGGTITLNSTVGEGTRVGVQLPPIT